MFKSSETHEKLYKPDQHLQSRALEPRDKNGFQSVPFPTSGRQQRNGFDFNQYARFGEVDRPQLRQVENRYPVGQQKRSWPSSKDEVSVKINLPNN